MRPRGVTNVELFGDRCRSHRGRVTQRAGMSPVSIDAGLSVAPSRNNRRAAWFTTYGAAWSSSTVCQTRNAPASQAPHRPPSAYPRARARDRRLSKAARRHDAAILPTRGAVDGFGEALRLFPDRRATSPLAAEFPWPDHRPPHSPGPRLALAWTDALRGHGHRRTLPQCSSMSPELEVEACPDAWPRLS